MADAVAKKPAFRALSDQLRFLRSWLANPLRIGAVAPSSKHLARAMAAVIDPTRPGLVVELGPGTGVVTEAILERGIAPERLLSIEFNSAFVPLLRERFQGVNVVEGDAFAIADIVGRVTRDKVVAVVSSLPLFVHPEAKRIKMVQDAFDLMPPGAPFIQFSYAFVSPIPTAVPGLTVETSGWIWGNVPPARVWTYRRS